MTRELVFHLGDRKAGSTSIQDTLRLKNWIGSVPSLGFRPKMMHYAYVAAATVDGGMNPKRRESLVELANQLANSPEDIGVISSESFEGSNPALLRDLLENFLPGFAKNARFIAYVRPHADRLLSSYSERVKVGGFSGSISEHVDVAVKKKELHYLPRFQRWRQVFGDRFELRPMIRAQLHENCVVRDFLSFAFQSKDFTLLSDPASNVSLGLEDHAALIEFHRYMVDLPPASKAQPSIGRYLAIFLAGLPRQTSTKPAMTHATYLRLRDVFSADAQALDRMFFDGTPMMDALNTAEMRTVEVEQSLRVEDHFGADAVRLIQAFSQLVTKLASYEPKVWSQHITALRLGRAGPLNESRVTANQGKGLAQATRLSKVGEPRVQGLGASTAVGMRRRKDRPVRND